MCVLLSNVSEVHENLVAETRADLVAPCSRSCSSKYQDSNFTVLFNLTLRRKQKRNYQNLLKWHQFGAQIKGDPFFCP